MRIQWILGILAVLAMAASTIAAPITYTVYGDIFPTVSNPGDSGSILGHVRMDDGSATGHATLYWTGYASPIDFDFTLSANIPGPPDQRFYADPAKDNSMLLADWEGGAAAIFSSAGWDSASGTNGWDTWTVATGIFPGDLPARLASITRSVEGALPINEPAAIGLSLMALVGFVALRPLVK